MWNELAYINTVSVNQPCGIRVEWLLFFASWHFFLIISVTPCLLFFLQMYIALISAHALGLSGMHFFTCIKVQWNGKASLSGNIDYDVFQPKKRQTQNVREM